MKTIVKSGTLLLLLSLLTAAPTAADPGGGRADTVRRAQAQTRELAAEFADLVKDLVAEGRIDEARETLENLDRILALLAGLDSLAKRLEGPGSIDDPAARPRTARKTVRDVPVGPGNRPGPPPPPFVRPPDPGAETFEGPAPVARRKVAIGGGAGRLTVERRRDAALLREGGSAATEEAVRLALRWLADHQDPDGFWDADGFSKRCTENPCGGPGYALYDPGVTGLALLAFVGAGETHKAGEHREVVADAARYLKRIQDPEGCFGPRTTNHYTYNHAIDALAMAELFGLTQSPLFKQSAQSAMDFIAKAQNPYLAWRYGVRPQDNDTSVSGWMTAALHAGQQAGLKVGEEGFHGMKAWLDKVTEPEYGRVGYTTRGTGPARPMEMLDRFPPDRSESLTGVGIHCRVLLGEQPRKSEMIQKGVDLCLKNLPVWDEKAGSIDLYYWYHGSLALFQVGGDAWKGWNAALKPALVDHQRTGGDEKGSWDPVGVWCKEGGRVYSTALGALMLETYYRTPRIFGR